MRLDDFTIRRIGWEPQESMPMDYCTVDVGKNGVTKIDAVEQCLGEYSIVWFQVWKGKSLVTRFNAKNIDSIDYKEL